MIRTSSCPTRSMRKARSMFLHQRPRRTPVLLRASALKPTRTIRQSRSAFSREPPGIKIQNLKILDANELNKDNKFILDPPLSHGSAIKNAPSHETIEITHDPVIRSRKKIWS